MADIIAQLEVLSRESGCLIDLSALIDLSVCPKIDIKTDRPHTVEKKDDYVCVTPTDYKSKPKAPKHEYTKRCSKPGGGCYEVSHQVCKKPTVVLDLELLVLVGLLTEDELKRYMKTLGKHDECIKGEGDDVTMDPLLSAQIGDDGSILDLELLGEKGLLSLDLLGLGGKGGLLNIGGKRSDTSEHLIDANVAIEEKRGLPQLLNLQIGGKDKGGKPAIIDIKALTQSSRDNECHDGGHDGGRPLLDLDVLGEAADNNGLIDIDILTKIVNDGSGKGHGGSKGGRPLLDLDILSEAADSNGLIDIDILTKLVGGGKDKCKHEDKCKNNDKCQHKEDKCKNNDKCHHKEDKCKDGGDKVTHYQPICGKGFKKEHRDRAEKCHATDVNHCLALCESKAALLTIGADVKVGDIANIQICAAIDFNSGSSGDNCHYMVAPETEPCHDGHLEYSEYRTSFLRN